MLILYKSLVIIAWKTLYSILDLLCYLRLPHEPISQKPWVRVYPLNFTQRSDYVENLIT